ncbi:MAG TPA: hypothetical protein VD902_00465, partial [Symbiobacteriaceae bacterium]|nr:hypothetical protein [Symbiobacteriaceae bacterium]
MCNDNPIYTQKERGYVLISTLIALAVISLLGAASLSWAASSLKLSSRAVATEQAFYLANAGVEEASARARAGDLPARLERTVEIAPGITGQYAVDITEEPGNLYRVVSTGTAGAGRQTITATIRGVGQGTHVAYQSLMYTGGSLVVENQMDICGDIVVTGNAEFRAQATVWNQTKGQNKKSPCDSIMGTGKAEVGGLIDLQNSQTIIQ